MDKQIFIHRFLSNQVNVEDKAGTYQVTFGAEKEGVSLEKTITVTVIGDNATDPDEPETPQEDDYSIITDMEEMTLVTGQVSEENVLAVSNVAVLNNTTSQIESNIPVTVKSSNLQDRAGMYQVSFATDKSEIAEKTITVTVIDANTNPDSGIDDQMPQIPDFELPDFPDTDAGLDNLMPEFELPGFPDTQMPDFIVPVNS